MFTNHSVECPDCGDDRTATVAAGLDMDGQRVRERACVNCGRRFSTVEIVFPFSFPVVDVTKRERRDVNGESKEPPRRRPDRLLVRPIPGTSRTAVSITLVKGRRTNRCRKGLHQLKGENVYINPNNGQRICNPCRRETARRRYHDAMTHPDYRRIRREIGAEYRPRRREYARQWARWKRGKGPHPREQAA